MVQKKSVFWGVIFVLMMCFEVPAEENKKMSIEKEDIEKQISYALGYDIAERLKENFSFDPDSFIMGVTDRQKNQPKFSEEQLMELLYSYQRTLRQKQTEKMKLESEDNRKKGAAFLEANSGKEGVIALPSGLQYKILVQGEGPLPKSTDTVECHYQGTLIDDMVFDSSYERGKPAVFQVGQVIQGWIEALQIMKVGSTWMLYVPPDLAYGDRGAGDAIKPGATLVFKVELLGIIN